MPKEAEQAYLANIGAAGRQHSLLKPFSDPLCGINLMSIGTIMSLLPPAPARILDMGCGGGWTSMFLAKRGYQVTGQDIAPDMIDLANENRQINGLEHQLDFICSDFESLGLDSGFDAAFFLPMPHDLFDIFYERRSYPARMLSKRRWRMTKRVLRLLFNPNPGASAIVVMTK